MTESQGLASAATTWRALSLCFALACCCACTDSSSSSAPASTASPSQSSVVFTECAEELGVKFRHQNGMTGEYYFSEIVGPGVALFDFDRDGDLDLFAVQGGPLGPKITNDARPSNRLYQNLLSESGELRFEDVTERSGDLGKGYGMGVAAGDYDRDGYPDLYLTNFEANRLLRNQGDGTFRDVTQASGTQDIRWSSSASFADFDGDGWLDLYVCNYVDFTWTTHKPCFSESSSRDYCGPLSFNSYPDRLFRNRGDGTFEDVSARTRVIAHYGGALGVTAADFNGDGRLDFYVANDGRDNQLWLQAKDGTFQNEALLAGCAFNEDGRAEASMGVDAADFDGDGDEDLFMTHLTDETNTLYLNLGGGMFEDYTFEASLGVASRSFTGFGTAFFDYDNDGWLDLYIANGAVQTIETLARQGDPFPLHQLNQLFRNEGNGQFRDVSKDVGPALAISEVSRGLAAGDLDNDGDTDLVVANNHGPLRILRNDIGNRRRWLGVRLLSSATGSDLVGARVALELEPGRTLWRRFRADSSYCSANDPRVLFGLGEVAAPRNLTVYYADGTREQWSNLPTNQWHTLIRGEGQTP